MTWRPRWGDWGWKVRMERVGVGVEIVTGVRLRVFGSVGLRYSPPVGWATGSGAWGLGLSVVGVAGRVAVAGGGWVRRYRGGRGGGGGAGRRSFGGGVGGCSRG